MDDLTREQSQTIVEGETRESFILTGVRAAPNWRPRTAGRLAVTLLKLATRFFVSARKYRLAPCQVKQNHQHNEGNQR